MRFANRTFCLCRVAVSDGTWFHTVPAMGEYPGGNVCHNGTPVKDAVIVIDREAYDRILSAFEASGGAKGDFPGLLVDREHFSLDSDKPSDAMAWAKQIREDADGLWTRWDFTPPGQEAWDNKVLISRSPVMLLERIAGNRFRPVRLESIAMTNTPHFETLSTLAAARAADQQGTAAPDAAQTQGDPTMKKLLALLGLPETATEDEAVAAAQVIIDRASAADAEMKKAQAACRKAACDAFLIRHKDSIADEAKFRLAYEANPEATEAAFGAFRVTPPPAARIIARDASTPGAGDTGATLVARYDAMPDGVEKRKFLRDHAEAIHAARSAAV
jgi:phage I-like protein